MELFKLLAALATLSHFAIARPGKGGSVTSKRQTRVPSITSSSEELPYTRSFLYAGGSYADDGTGKGEHIYHDQMYVEHLVPVKGITQEFPLVMIHGQAQTGTVSVAKLHFIGVLIIKEFLEQARRWPRMGVPFC